MSATITIEGKTVCALEVPASNMGLPSTQCAWLRGRVNDALTAELAKQQGQTEAQPKACAAAAASGSEEENEGEEEETNDA